MAITVTYCQTIYNYCHIKVPIIVNLYTVAIILNFLYAIFKNNLRLLSNLNNSNFTIIVKFINNLQLLSNLNNSNFTIIDQNYI